MLRVTDLNVYYGESHVIHDIGFELADGDALAIVGRNGMGKSTLLKALIGMIPARSGSILLNDKELRGLPSYRRVEAGLAFVPQGRLVFSQLTVEENLMTGLETGRYDGIPAFVYESFPVLSEMKGRKAGNLSGGQQQQLAIARALVSRPRVLILDEPTEGIQPSIIKEIAHSLVRLRKELGISLIVSEQVLSFALEVADWLLVIDRGRFVKQVEKSSVDLDEIRAYLTVQGSLRGAKPRRQASMADHPRARRPVTVVLVPLLVHMRIMMRMAMPGRAVAVQGLHHVRLVRAFLVAGLGNPHVRRHQVQQRCAQEAAAFAAAARAGGRRAEFRHRPPYREAAAALAVIVINRHRALLQLARARSPPLTFFVGPDALGLMSKSKMAVGMYSDTQAFGMSTTPLTRPSMGAVERMV